MIMPKTKKFFEEMVTEGNPKSSRRLVTLLISALFIITCATILLLLIALFISIGRLQGLNVAAMTIIVNLLGDVLKYEMFIILAGLFFTTMTSRTSLLASFANLFRKTESTTTTLTETKETTTPPGEMPSTEESLKQ